jgi:EAL domain-containing protein (putative c-di-GMP-specific phosphodiesterase class I)
MNATVSIVVAVKNALPWLQRLVFTLRDVGIVGARLVIVDGGSTDGTVDWLAEVAPAGAAVDLRWVSQQDSGIAEAWNRGVSLAESEWVVFLGADDLPGDADDAAITRAVIAMAPSLKLRVVAEGVETSEQLQFLREHGCDDVQGFYFGAPMPEADFLRALDGDRLRHGAAA